MSDNLLQFRGWKWTYDKNELLGGKGNDVMVGIWVRLIWMIWINEIKRVNGTRLDCGKVK